MIISTKTTVTKEVVIIKDILCNKCGNSCCTENGNKNGLIEEEVFGTYDSEHLEDGKLYVFSICEKCLSEIFATFKHQPDRKQTFSGFIGTD